MSTAVIGEAERDATRGSRAMGMGDDPNALACLRTVEAFRQGDFDTAASLIAEDVVWHVPGDHPLAGEYVGRERLLEYLARLGPLGFTNGEHDVFADDEDLYALSFIAGRREGLEVETRVVSVFHFRGDGIPSAGSTRRTPSPGTGSSAAGGTCYP
jgi:ketosteroid isomerase-like protein